MFRRLRVVILLGVLAVVAATTYYQRTAVVSWTQPLLVEIYPINATGSAEVAQYIAGLQPASFSRVTAFLEREGARWGMKLQPLVLVGLRPEVRALPPAYPGPGAHPLRVMLWSLQLRYWVTRHTSSYGLGSTTVQLFVLFHPAREGKTLAHSVGLQKGLIGVVQAFGHLRQEEQNAIVITHELLHTLGAADRYGPEGYPLFPEGFADPEQAPLFPQRRAEIMAGRMAVSDEDAVMPESLEQCIIGLSTAREIRWQR